MTTFVVLETAFPILSGGAAAGPQFLAEMLNNTSGHKEWLRLGPIVRLFGELNFFGPQRGTMGSRSAGFVG